MKQSQKHKKNFNKTFNTGFLIFFFVFLFCWCCMSLINKEYQLLLFSLPFWITEIRLIKKTFTKKRRNTSKSKKSKRKSDWSFERVIIIGVLLVMLSLLFGIGMLFAGIKGTYELAKTTENYAATNGYFHDYDIYSSKKGTTYRNNRKGNKTTYRLTYIYQVDGQEYTISTDYGTNYIPDKNSVRTIKYNPDNPEEAVLEGTNKQNGLIFMGAFFTLVSSAFVIVGLTVHGCFDRVKIDVIGTYSGVVFLIIGTGIVFVQYGTTLSWSETIKSFGLWIFIPIMFVTVGLFQLMKCLSPAVCSKRAEARTAENIRK